MRKIILSMSVSLDGYFEGPGKDISWHLVDDELHYYFNEQLRGMGAFLEGRVSYELMEGFWPTADQDPDSPPPMVEFAGIWRDVPKYVFSRTLGSVGPNATLVRDVVPEQIRELKSQAGGDLVVGGANLAATFMEHDLIDEFMIYVHPVVLGKGRPLFESPDVKLDLKHIGSRTFGNGVVLLHYVLDGGRLPRASA